MKMTVAEFIEYYAECQVATEYDDETGETIKYEKGIYFLHD